MVFAQRKKKKQICFNNNDIFFCIWFAPIALQPNVYLDYLS